MCAMTFLKEVRRRLARLRIREYKGQAEGLRRTILMSNPIQGRKRKRPGIVGGSGQSETGVKEKAKQINKSKCLQ